MSRKPLVTITQVPNTGKATFETTDDTMLVIHVTYQTKAMRGDSMTFVAADTKANCIKALAEVTGITEIEYDCSCYCNVAPNCGSDLVFMVYNFENTTEHHKAIKKGTTVWKDRRYGASCLANIMPILTRKQLLEVTDWFNHEWE